MNGINLLRTLVHLSVLLIILVVLLLLTGLRNGEAASTDIKSIDAIVGIQLSSEAAAGKILFKQNCASCHNRNMVDPLVGPALKGSEDRWAEYGEEALINWVKNSKALVEQKHPRAVKLWTSWRKSEMPAFSALSTADVKSILKYVKTF